MQSRFLSTADFAAARLALPAAGHADKRSNVLAVGFNNEVDTLDPATGFSGADYAILYSIYDRLISVRPEDHAPDARHWPRIGNSAGPDKRDFEMTIRPGVKFHDGTPVDAEAVKASLMHFKEMKRLNDHRCGDLDRDHRARQGCSPSQPGIFGAFPPCLQTAPAWWCRRLRWRKLRKGLFPAIRSAPGRSWCAPGHPAPRSDMVKFPDYWNPSRIKLSGIQYTTHPEPNRGDQRYPLGPGGQRMGRRSEEPAGAARQPAVARGGGAEHATPRYYIALRHDMSPTDNKLVCARR